MNPLNDYGHAYLHISPKGMVSKDGVMFTGKDRPRDAPALINCSGYTTEDILEVIKGFIRG